MECLFQLKKFQQKKGPSLTPPKLPTKPAEVEPSQTAAENEFVSNI
jgi:hypothetical protein